MTPAEIQKLLERVASGELSVPDGMERLAALPAAELAHTTLDTHRELRQGMPETVYGAGKSAEQLIDILGKLHEVHDRALATRVTRRKARMVMDALPDAKAICELSDGVVLVVRADFTAAQDVESLLEILDRDRILGMLLNGAKVDQARYGYATT